MSFTTGYQAGALQGSLCQPLLRAGRMLRPARSFAAGFSQSRIRLQSDLAAVRRRARQLLGKCAGVSFAAAGEKGHTLLLEEPEQVARVFQAFGYEYSSAALHLNRAMVEEDCCRIAFLRGAFLTGGSCLEPGKGYHLELATSHYNVARETALLLEEMGLPCGFVSRRGNYVLYYKDSSVIEDLIGQMGAGNAAMHFRLQKVEKDFRNNINRKVNCETANLGKTVEAAARQCQAIRILEQAGQLEALPETAAPHRPSAHGAPGRIPFGTAALF